jgi:Uma2 family endonuclease
MTAMTRTLDITPFRPTPLAGPISYEQFLTWDGENQHVEWVNGEVIPMAPISDAHNELTAFLCALLRLFAEQTKLGVVRHDPFQMKTGPNLPGRAPDLMFILEKNRPRLKRTYLEGPADLVIEVLSPGNQGVDRGDKYLEYERGGVPEYWLLDPERQEHEFYQLGSNGRYRLTAIPADGVYRSPAINGLWIKPAWLSQRPRPTVISIAKEWGLV